MSDQVRLRESMKRLVGALWWGAAATAPGLAGLGPHDVIVGLEAGE